MSNSSSIPFDAALFGRTDDDIVDPNDVPVLVSEITIDQYFQVAIVTILVYDALITMDKEARYFWKIPRKPVDFVYFANRYIGIFGGVAWLFWNSLGANLIQCNFSQWTKNLANWTTVIFIDYILTIRVLALYSQERMLAIYLKTLLALEAAFKFGLFLYINMLEHVGVGSLAKDVTFCDVDALGPWQWGLVDWIIPMIYGVLLMGLALYKAAEYWRLSAGFKGFTLVKVLVQDQVIYFLFFVLCCMINIIEFRIDATNEFLSDVLTAAGNPIFLCILGNRMLFNLKEAGQRGQNMGTSYRVPSITVSEMEFA